MQGKELEACGSSWGEFAVNRASLKGTRHVQGAPPRPAQSEGTVTPRAGELGTWVQSTVLSSCRSARLACSAN